MNDSLPPLPTVPWVAALHDLVRERLGYEVPEHRMTLEIAPRVLAHAETHGHLDPRGFVDTLRTSPDGEAWDALVQVVTVGETYFFRHAGQLEALAARCRRRFETAGRALEIWSAGCATGEEPYSLAMLLDEASVPFHIVGSDVDESALAKARAATGFSDRSVSHLPVQLRERWLEALGPGRWRLMRPTDLPVRFVRHNLIHDAPLHPEGGGAWDAILCRNVLLYFPPKTGCEVVEQLGRTLAPEGGLWVGPCDHVADPGPGLGWVSDGEERFLAPPGVKSTRERPSPPRPRQATAFQARGASPTRLIERGLRSTARRAVEERLREVQDDGEALVLLGAFLLREHAFDEALVTFGRAEGAHPKPAGLAYLQGVALLKAGRHEDAAAAFGTALEDDPDDWASSYQLAMLYRRSGRSLREEVMLLRTADRLGASTPRPPALGAGARLVNSVHAEPRLTLRLVEERLTHLGVVSRARTNEGADSGRPS